MKYKHSRDGIEWLPDAGIPMDTRFNPVTGSYNDEQRQIRVPWSSMPGLFFSGQTVVIAQGEAKVLTTRNIWPDSPIWSDSVSIYYSVGTITGNQITWTPTTVGWTETGTCAWGNPYWISYCGMTIGIRYVSVFQTDSGPFFSYNWYRAYAPYDGDGDGDILCTGDVTHYYSESILKTVYGGTTGNINGNAQPLGDCYRYDENDHFRSVVLPAIGGLRIVYQRPDHAYADGWPWPVTGTNIRLEAVSSYGSETIDQNIANAQYGVGTPEFSATADTQLGAHVVYKMPDETTNYAYSQSIGNWQLSRNLFYGQARYPTLTVDFSTDDVYAFAVRGVSILLRKGVAQGLPPTWSQTVVPVIRLSSLTHLGSNYASVGSSGAGRVSLVWTEGASPFTAMYASIPIQTVWSPFGSPSDPWNGYGLAPYGQYFSNLGEHVSTSSGMLTVRQTDLVEPGRGLDLEITRVYTEPNLMLNGAPFEHEPYPWAPMRNGWQLNFPWFTPGPSPRYIHLWNGQGYRIPASFWNSRGTFENHQGEHFRLLKYYDGSPYDLQPDDYPAVLQTKSGVSYYFGGRLRLVEIVDSTGNNTISFSYNNDLSISRITDTVGRTFQFCYTNDLLESIRQGAVDCTGSYERKITYGYSGQALTSVADVNGRETNYEYQTVPPAPGPWLLNRVVYPTRWYTSYVYEPDNVGLGQVYAYRVAQQITTSESNNVIRRMDYSFIKDEGAQIVSSTVSVYDGTLLVGYTDYAFSYTGMNMNISDANHRLVRGISQRFGVHGEVPTETVLVVDGSGIVGSYSNFYRYDLWGNLIYSRRAVDPSTNWYHETFNAYHGNLPPGFRSFAETFSQNNGHGSDNQWTVEGGDWRAKQAVGFREDDFVSGWNSSGGLLAFGSSPEGVLLVSARPLTSEDEYRLYERTLPSSLSSTEFGYVSVRFKTSLPGDGVGARARVWYSDFTFTEVMSEGVAFSTVWETRTVRLPQGKIITKVQLLADDDPDTVASRVYKVYYDYVVIANAPAEYPYEPVGEYYAAGSQPQETSFAWTDIGKANVILQARLYITEQAAQADTRVGLIVHYPGTGDNKWALVFHNWNSIALLEEHVSWRNSVGYVPTYNNWYWFKVKAEGSEVWGKVWRLGDAEPDWMVHDYFTTNVDATGIGLYAGGYEVLFDDVTVNVEGFSNLFIPDGAAGLEIPTALAGQAEFQNGAGTLPFEAYYGYSSWGGMVEAKTRYDSLGGMQWLTASMTYDGYGNLRTSTDPRGNSTYYEYDSSYYAFMINQTRLEGATKVSTLYTFNFTTGNVQSVTDPMGYPTSYQNDNLGRVKRADYPLGAFAQYSYDDQANLVEIVNQDNWKVRQVFDGLGRLVRLERFDGATVYSSETYAYDWANRPLSSTDSLGNITRYTYDVVGRVLSVTRPDGSQNGYLYNGVSSWVRSTDEDGNHKCTIFDRMGRTISLIERAAPDCSSGTVTNYFFDRMGNLLKVINAKGQQTTHQYDNLNRLTQTSYWDGTKEQYKIYDENGNLLTKWDRNVVRTEYTYDALNRVKTTARYGNPTTTDTYAYDRNSNLLQIASQNATITYTYDARNRVLTETYYINPGGSSSDVGCEASGGGGPPGPLGPSSASLSSVTGGGVSAAYGVRYAYRGDTLRQITYPNGLRANYTYDSLGRVQSVFTPGGTTYASFTYNRNDQLVQVRYGNTLVNNYIYDRLGRSLSLEVKDGNQNRLLLNYAYNRTGTVSDITGKVNGVDLDEEYSYDPFQRLVNSKLMRGSGPSATTTTLSYQYDNMGNRRSQSVNGQVTDYVHNFVNALTQANSPDFSSVTLYTYDRNGNLLTKNINSSGTSSFWTYAWDASDRLLRVVKDGTVKGVYAYDGFGRRVESVEGTTTSFYGYLGTETLCERAKGQTNPTNYIYAVGLRIAKVTGSTVSYYHTDHLGSTRLVVSSGRQVLFSDSYQPFGQDNGTPAGSERYKFTGKPYSQTTGLYYSFQRWYDPEIGRFISQDLVAGSISQPQTLNRYTYVANSPTNYVDPTGLYAETPFDIASAVYDVSECIREPNLVNCGIAAIDVALIFVPGVPALAGPIYRGGSFLARHGDEATDVARVIANLDGALLHLDDTAKVFPRLDDAIDTSIFWRNIERGGAWTGKFETHHLLPKQFKALFETAFQNAGLPLGIEDFTIQLERGVHKIVHGKSIGRAADWNTYWKVFFARTPDPKADQIIRQLKTMMADFNLL